MELKADIWLQHRYWGPRLKSYYGSNRPAEVKRTFAAAPMSEFPAFSLETALQEFSFPHQGDYRNPSLMIRRKNGYPAGRMQYQGFEITNSLHIPEGLPHIRPLDNKEAGTLSIYFQDTVSKIQLTMHYSILEDSAAIIRSLQITNQGNEPVWIERALSALIDTAYANEQLVTFYGTHQKEFQINRQNISHGSFSIGSTRGASSPQYPPFAALCSPETTEHAGDVRAFQLLYSGCHCIQTERDQYEHLRIALGIHPDEFCWKLLPGESFQTPEAVLIYSGRGFNGMSQEFHQLYTKHLFPHRWVEHERPVLLNSWEMCYFDVSEEKMLQVIQKAANLGFELVVLDDGWFGRRNSSKSSLGDWEVNTEKFPNGLTPLLECARKNEIQFGVWFEPEMISPDSKLMQAHPDWHAQIPGYTPLLGRNQLVLDLTRPEIQDYVLETLSGFLRLYPVSYVKWDMNRHITDPGSLSLAQDRTGEFFHRYILGLYYILEQLTVRFPDILFENCSSGGGRFDAGMCFYMPQTWCSDNTDALDRQAIQYGASYLFPPSAVTSHVSAIPNHQTGRQIPYSTRAAAASSANMGYELNILDLSLEEEAQIKKHLSEYKGRRKLLMTGKFYRLQSPFDNRNCAWMIIDQNKDRAVIYYFIREYDTAALSYLLRIPYLDADKIYMEETSGRRFTGEELIHAGLTINPVPGDFPVVEVYLTAENIM